MTILDWLMLILGLFIVLPSIVYLTVKFGVVGFYKGKEEGSKRDINLELDKKEK